MAADFCTMTAKGSTPEKTVRLLFSTVQDQDRYDNGHSYSGGFGMCPGLTITKKAIFPDYDSAEKWLFDNAQKWENAIAVRFRNKNGNQHWLIGAWCSS